MIRVKIKRKRGMDMLSENVRILRKSKGLSQEELAVRLNVVRQTISKWEQGLSVPDADMLLSLSEALEVPVSTLLRETVSESKTDELEVISEKLEIINLQLVRQKEERKKRLHWFFIFSCVSIAGIFMTLLLWKSPYLAWDFQDPETAIAGTVCHAFEWLFIRSAPVALIAVMAGAFLTRKKE